MADLVFDERVGWFDPDEAYCVTEGCNNLAVGERFIGIYMDASEPTDGFWEQVELLCSDCLSV